MTSWLWEELRDLFAEDDGSLPEIRVSYTRREAVVEGYSLLRRRAAAIVTEDPSFYSKAEASEKPLDSVANASALVVSGEAHAFHVVLDGLGSKGVVIPPLGVFVFEDQLALDYRMGEAWAAPQLESLFELLAELVALDPGASLSLEDGVLERVEDRFRGAWTRWRGEQSARGEADVR